MAPPLLKLDDIRLSFGGPPLLDGAALSLAAGDRIALVGRNGSGKSTLLKIAAGMIEPQDGEVFLQPGTTVRYLPQMPDFGAFTTVGAYVEAGLGPADDRYRATYLLESLGLTEAASPASLSGGEARRAALARVMAPQPDILLMDEPTNHLDLSTIEWLEDELSRSSSALVLISHDRRFLERVSRATVWLDRGTTRRLDSGFADFEAWRDRLLEEEELEQHKLARQIVREEHWLRYGVTARRKRNMRRLGELQDMRGRLREHRGPEGVAKLSAGEAAESGKLVVEAKSIGKRFGEREIVRDFSVRIGRGARIGLVGPNGAGKTTLLKMLIGELAPDTGTVRLGVNLAIAALDQRRDAAQPDETLAHFLTDGRGETLVVQGEERHVVSYMKDFLFRPEQARTPVRELSGGERARLILARLLARPSNLLVLDEPTNDLDMETLDLLQEMVASYAGTVLLVSHDRDFLDRTVTSIIAPDGNARWLEYAGGYTDMLAQRGGRRFDDRRPQPRKEADAKGDAASAPAPRERRDQRKLSFKQRHALETLPARMDGLAARIAATEAKLEDPQLYVRDPQAFSRLTATLEADRSALAAHEEEWLELEMLREELEG
jgi:ATP-binding cassette subfamily F protein uup